ncbi:MAG: hypothetical protein ACRDMZ_15475, partial [Solirubrobacteraceae bacterium]
MVAAIALLASFRGNVAGAADVVGANVVTAADGAGAAAQPGTPAWAEGADVVEHLGARLPLDLSFADASGQRVPLRSLFDGVH